MKKLSFIAVTMMLALVPALQSCLDDDGPSYSDLAIATIRQIEGKEYYFSLDDGKKMYPGDITAVQHYPFVDGKRAFVSFNRLEEKVPGYDYNIQVERIDSILTKDIIPLTEETADSIGDNRINVTYRWVAQGYLNMEYQFYGTRNPNKRHMLNLVHNQDTELVDEDGYINLEFRHNSFEDNGGFLGEGLVSFKLDKVAEEMKTAKGLRIRVKTIYDGEKFYNIDFEQTEKSSKPAALQLKSATHTAKTSY